MIHPVVQTDRLRLMPFSEEDLPALVALHADPEVNRFLAPGPVALQPGDVRDRLDRYLEDNQRHKITGWKLETLDGVLIGRAGFSKLKDPEGYELGYVLQRNAWGAGYATEIACALVAWFFEETAEPQLFATAEEAHDASIRVLQKAGLHLWQDREIDGVACRIFRVTRRQFLTGANASLSRAGEPGSRL